jgi:putative ABC transport system permease protein
MDTNAWPRSAIASRSPKLNWRSHSAAFAGLSREFPKHSAGWTVAAVSLRDVTIGRFGRATWLPIAAVAVVPLVTCVNVGGLLVARAVARERDTAVRTV